LIGKLLYYLDKDGYSAEPSYVAKIVRDTLRVSEYEVKRVPEKKVKYSRPVEYVESIINKKICVDEALRRGEGRCILGGWIESKMDVGRKLFIILRDWSGKIQCVTDRGTESYDRLSKVPREAFVTVSGILRRDERAPHGVELYIERIEHLGGLESPPISLLDLSRSSVSVRLRHRYLDMRRRQVQSIMSFRAKLLRVLREFFYEEGFVEINTPKIITTATEGGAELFPILFYGKEAFLAQSPQLYKQMALNMFEKVFEIASYYRAQKFDTPRHLAEFWSIDVEASLYTLDDLLHLIEKLVSYSIERLRVDAERELGILKIKLPEVKIPFPRITYGEALEMLREKGIEAKFGEDLGASELKSLSDVFHGPYFIIYWPANIRAFYYKPKPGDPELTLSFDFMWPLRRGYPLELASGGERINDPSILERSLRSRGLYPEAYEWYINMFRYGMPPHGGFGLGLDRFLMALLNLGSIIDTVFSPRSPKYSRP
jgi:aspartyl-tRNA synthetase